MYDVVSRRKKKCIRFIIGADGETKEVPEKDQIDNSEDDSDIENGELDSKENIEDLTMATDIKSLTDVLTRSMSPTISSSVQSSPSLPTNTSSTSASSEQIMHHPLEAISSGTAPKKDLPEKSNTISNCSVLATVNNNTICYSTDGGNNSPSDTHFTIGNGSPAGEMHCLSEDSQRSSGDGRGFAVDSNSSHNSSAADKVSLQSSNFKTMESACI